MDIQTRCSNLSDSAVILIILREKLYDRLSYQFANEIDVTYTSENISLTEKELKRTYQLFKDLK